MEESPEIIVKTAKHGDDEKSTDHRKEVSSFVSPAFGQKTHQKDAQERAIGIPKDSEHDGNDARIKHDLGVGGRRANENQEHGKNHRAPTSGTNDCAWEAFLRRYERYQSSVKLVASAFSAVLSEPIAVEKMPAINTPRRPGGSSWTM